MIGNPTRKRLRRLLAYLSIPLVAASAVVVLTATPAQAATYQGTFRISSGFSCLEVYGGGTGDGTPIVQEPCDSSNNQRWAIYLDEGRNVYWIIAYGGAWPLNKCMDGPDSSSRVHIWGCHGGHQQRWLLSINTTTVQEIRQAGTNECVGIIATPFLLQAVQQVCNPEFTTRWLLVPA
jgi:hypothetical protein